jgi:RNA polymerase sigma factor (sigma-70 family)
MTEKCFTSSGGSEDGHGSDLDLCRDIALGSLSSWHRFVSQYSSLIFSVIHRYHFTKDEDELRNLFVDILDKLYNGDLAKYRGEASLSTWLVVYSRCRIVDHTRKLRGRQRRPKGYDELTDFDKCVLQHYFDDHLPLEIVIHILRWNGFEANATAIIESVKRIDRIIGQRYLKKLEDEWLARKHDIDSSKLLTFMIKMRSDYAARADKSRPDHDLLRKEAEELADQVRSSLEDLTPMEREIVHLHFNRSWPARRIAERLEIKNQSRVYYIIKKIIGKLRGSLPDDGK